MLAKRGVSKKSNIPTSRCAFAETESLIGQQEEAGTEGERDPCRITIKGRNFLKKEKLSQKRREAPPSTGGNATTMAERWGPLGQSGTIEKESKDS